MTNEEVTRKVHSAILNYRGPKATTEDPKLDFKKQWKNIKTDNAAAVEFLKDVTAIANTFGLDGFLIYGLEENNGSLIPRNTSLIDSGFNNDRELIHFVNKSVTPFLNLHHHVVEYNGYLLSVIQIPPSLEKPHAILPASKDGAPLIYVRKGANNAFATRHDIELMYYDRKNIVPEYKIFAFALFCKPILTNGYSQPSKTYPQLRFANLTIENVGQRVVCSFNTKIKATFEDSSYVLFTSEELSNKSKYNWEPLIVRQNDLLSLDTAIFSKESLAHEEDQSQKLLSRLIRENVKYSLVISLSSNQEVECEITLHSS